MSKIIIIKNILLICLASFFPNSRRACNMRIKSCNKIEKLTGIGFTVSSIGVGINGKIFVKGLKLEFPEKFTIFISRLSLALSIRSFGRRRLRLSHLFIDHIGCTIIGPRKKNREAAHSITSSKDIIISRLQRRHYKRLFSIINFIFEQAPSSVKVNKMAIPCHFSGTSYEVYFEDLYLQNNTYTVTGNSSYPGLSPFNLRGRIDKKQQALTLEMTGASNLADPFSFVIKNKNISFSNKCTRLSFLRKGPSAICVGLSLQDSIINWKALASKPQDVSLLEMQLDCSLIANSFTVENTSTIKYNEIEMNVFASQPFYIGDKFKAGIYVKDISMAELLRSFPCFTFKKIYDLTFEGAISLIEVLFEVRLDEPSDYSFTVTSRSDQLKLAEYPGSWPDITIPFTHEVYDNGNFIRKIELCETNRDFLSFDKIPPLLSTIIAYTEDINFYHHCGVDDYFIGYALIENLEQKKFTRGGSTITMQLVRNLFLDHQKTIFRKIEEIFIALLLENIFNVPKKKILELYLNIIEFAPGIYGINEACQFYFLKPPQLLNLQECLVLSYIIPRPKYFLQAFMCSSEQLKRNLRTHIQSYCEKLCASGIISREDVNALSWSIKIKDKALSLICPN
jgi:hypothetical protein